MGFDALLLVSFGGPEGPEDVMPFLERVTAGRGVPAARLEQVAARYMELGGVSPINASNRALLERIRRSLSHRRPGLRVYWGNRNWHPLLADTVGRMRDDGVRRAAAFVTSAYSSYSSCRQYIEDIEAARICVGEGAPEVVKLRPYFDHPGFIRPLAQGLREARAAAGADAPVLMTAHSIPATMAAACDYDRQLAETARLVAGCAGEPPGSWSLVYQSRSGRPGETWLGPDLQDAIADLPSGPGAVIVVPIGFVSEHMEVVYDIDRQAAATATARGMRLVRAPTPGGHPDFVQMVLDLLEEAEGVEQPELDGRREGSSDAHAQSPPGHLGSLKPPAFPCRPGCCPSG